MKFFGLHSTVAPVDAAKLPSTTHAMVYGGLSFGVVSVIAYSIWAFHLVPGTGPMYSSVAAVYLVLSGLALSRLVVAPGAAKKFTLLFALCFLAYAVGWCALWFGLHGRYQADFWGALVGLAAMTAMLRSAFGSSDNFLRLLAVLFVCHSVGYYLGNELHHGQLTESLRGPAGRLAWGACHGLGFGAGLGYVLIRCQTPAKLPSAA